MESAASGILAAQSIARRLKSERPIEYPNYTMLGALSGYISDKTVENFQPMGANFGIFPPLDVKIRDKAERYSALAKRSLDWFDENF